MTIFPLIVLAVLICVIGGSYYRHRYVKMRWIERLSSYGFKVISLQPTIGSFPIDDNFFRPIIRIGFQSFPIVTYYDVTVRVNDSEPFVIKAAVKDYCYKFKVIYKDRELPE